MGAWIETYVLGRHGVLSWVSLPLWERGLKHKNQNSAGKRTASLPLWERGLKRSFILKDIFFTQSSLPLWERGLKPFILTF